MKKVLLVLLVLSSVNVFAQMADQSNGITPAASLGSAMKLMSASLRKVAAQAADVNKNANSEELALEFIKNTELSKTFVPSTIKQLPADQQDAKKQQYLKMLDDTAQLGRDLAAAFHNNDNKLANDILAKLSAAKKEGHIEFK